MGHGDTIFGGGGGFTGEGVQIFPNVPLQDQPNLQEIQELEAAGQETAAQLAEREAGQDEQEQQIESLIANLNSVRQTEGEDAALTLMWNLLQGGTLTRAENILLEQALISQNFMANMPRASMQPTPSGETSGAFLYLNNTEGPSPFENILTGDVTGQTWVTRDNQETTDINDLYALDPDIRAVFSDVTEPIFQKETVAPSATTGAPAMGADGTTSLSVLSEARARSRLEALKGLRLAQEPGVRRRAFAPFAERGFGLSGIARRGVGEALGQHAAKFAIEKQSIISEEQDRAFTQALLTKQIEEHG